jgi:thiol-disulfide isomerase/thioredoxin
VLSAGELRQFVARFKYRVVLLDFWASWCRRSREETEQLVRLQEELGGDDFQVISCNLDAPEKWASHTVPFLKSTGANFPCVVIPRREKGAVRAWLEPNWSYDLPARFLIDSQGRVVTGRPHGGAVTSMVNSARRLVSHGSLMGPDAGLSAAGAALRLKLIDVRKGKWESLTEVTSDPADARGMADEAAGLLAAAVDRSLNARIAILPFPSSSNRARPCVFGRRTAAHLHAALQRRGYYDLIEPEQTERMIRRLGSTALAIDFDPESVKGRLACDYLLVGWVRGNVQGYVSQPRIVGDTADENPTGDTGFRPRRDRTEP